MVRELAITASLGVAVMIVTNKMLLTILLSYLTPSAAETEKLRSKGGEDRGEWLWKRIQVFARPKAAIVVLAVTSVLLAGAAIKSRDLKTGDLGKGIPELRDDSRYNQDIEAIVSSFTIGVDVLSVIARAFASPMPRARSSACTCPGVPRLKVQCSRIRLFSPISSRTSSPL